MAFKRFNWLHLCIITIFLLIYHVIYFTIRLQFENRGVSYYDKHSNPFNKIEKLIKFLHHDKDDVSSTVCQKIDASSESSFQQVWESKKNLIMQVSLMSTNWTNDLRSNSSFTDWLEESMSYFTYSRLRHTSMSIPIDQTRSIDRIHNILEEKLNNPGIASPLRIVVFGGSVTTGHNCLDNIFDYLVRNDGRGNDRKSNTDSETKICSWSGRLQDMMDAVFGAGIVQIENMAIGGAQSEMSTAVMEFGLIPGSTPDVIIWDHGMNDALTRVNPNLPFYQTATIDSEQIFEKLQKFYQATTSLPTSCDHPDPPLVILLDSLLGQQVKLPRIMESLKSSTAISKMLTWYPDIWGVSYASIVRPYILSKVNNQHDMLRLLGSNDVVTHPGMMYHISIAWTIIFNFLYALHEHCKTREIIQQPSEQVRCADCTVKAQSNEYLRLSKLPELNNELRMLDVPELWRDRIPESISHRECLENEAIMIDATKKYTNHSSMTCYYAWMVNRVLMIESPQEVLSVIQPYLTTNQGWSAFGKERNEQPGGWLPVDGQGSSFDLKFDDVPFTVNSMTIVYMQSYSEKWFNSTLQIDCTFVGKDNITAISLDTSFMNIDANASFIESSTIHHFLSGYHEEETSILVPVKLPLPNRTVGDGTSTLLLNFQLMDGETFKIAGMALC